MDDMGGMFGALSTVTALQHSVHGSVARCSDCHGDVHRIVPHTEPRSAVHWSSLAAACARCHADGKTAAGAQIPVLRPVEGTILTVMRAAAGAVRAPLPSQSSIAGINAP